MVSSVVRMMEDCHHEKGYREAARAMRAGHDRTLYYPKDIDLS
jgi:hypothetical protein